MTNTTYIDQPTVSAKRGGARAGSGRKAGDVEFLDRKLTSIWLCDWFARAFAKRQKKARAANYAECEDAVNNKQAFEKPLFSHAALGAQWAKAARGERPFSAGQMKLIMEAAVKLKLTEQSAAKVKIIERKDQITQTILILILADGTFDQFKVESKQVENQKKKIVTCLLKLNTSSVNDFKNMRSKACTEIKAFANFVQKLELGQGSFCPILYLDEDGDEPDWSGYTSIFSGKTERRITKLKFAGEGNADLIANTINEVCTLQFRSSNLFTRNPRLLKEHMERTITKPKRVCGTKLAQ